MADPNLGLLVASTYEHQYPNKPEDNIFNSFATFYALGEKGFKVSAEGGRVFECPLEYAVNPTMQMVGEFDLLDTTRVDVFDVARYDQKICAGTVEYSYLEESRNRGSDRKFDVIEGRIENGRSSHMSTLNTQMWNTAAPSTNEITSIPTIISATPTVGTVGGINAASFSFWRNRQNAGTKTTTAFDNLRSTMETTFNQCSLGGIKKTPTFAIADRFSFEGYVGTQTSLIRYVGDGRSPMDASFMNSAVKFKEIPLAYDEDHPSARVDFLNPAVLKFEYLSGAWMKLDAAVVPNNQLVNTHKLYTFGNLISSARRHLGCVTAIT
jgi:hypothetical protein